MKKQLLVAAVAATMSAASMADISITGDAEFNYKNIENTAKNTVGNVKTKSNTTFTETNLLVKGKNGATTVAMDLQLDNAGDNRIVVENMYITTKLGPVSAKLGNYTSSTSGILGEIENGDRSDGKMTFSYTTNGIKFYAGNNGTPGNENAIKSQMFAGVVASVEGWKLQLKKNNNDKTSFGLAGKAGPVGIRFEYASDSQKGDAGKQNSGFFANFTTKMDNINLGLAMIKMDADGGITENDSAIFAVENNGAGDANTQLSASVAVDGTTYGVHIGQIGFKTSGIKDLSYNQVYASRTLASGVTADVFYTTQDWKDTVDNKEFKVKLTVKF